MALIAVQPPAGLYRNGAPHQAKGRWADANLVRFQQDQIKPIGGWQIRSGAPAFVGAGRALISWRDNSNNRWIAVGTHSKLYVQTEAGLNADITPVRRTVTLGSSPVATTSGLTIVQITDSGHGAVVGDFVTVTGAAAVGGIGAGLINGLHTITAVAGTKISFQAGGAASSTVTGGGTPTLAYQITAGRADAAQNRGYGGGAYGSGFYGAPRADTVPYLPASVWSLDSWGEDLVGCRDTDGRIYLWSLDTHAPAALVVNSTDHTNDAPTGNAGIVVTEEGFLFALGAGGDGRRIAWCDQQNLQIWKADATNQAGDYDVASAGTLQCGKAIPGGALIFTDVDVWLASYIGAPLVYGFQRKGSGCGVISKGCVAARDSTAVWMGRGGFWRFDGQGVLPLDCDVQDHVFGSLNGNQASKVTAVHLADHGEVWWFYPSAVATENDRYVCWAYRESERLGRTVWTVGTLGRTAGSGKGVFPSPLMVDRSGWLYEHETGVNFDGVEPFIETGPIEAGQGDRMIEVQRIVPDQLADGDCSATVLGRDWPNGAERSAGPYSLVSPTDLLFQAREVRLRFEGAPGRDWRIGATRLDVVAGDPL
jgi:hypothetical protein